MGGGGKNAASKAAKTARADEVARQERIRSGTTSINDTFGQFDDNFYNGLRQSFVDFARPQLDEQYGKARDQLTFALARSGTLDSSMRGERAAELQKANDLNLQDITGQARQYENDTRTNVEKARADLIAMLQATGDDQGAANAALSRAQILTSPPSYSPLGQLFQDGTSMLSQQAALEKSYALGLGAKPRFNTGLFGAGNNSVRVG